MFQGLGLDVKHTIEGPGLTSLEPRGLMLRRFRVQLAGSMESESGKVP